MKPKSTPPVILWEPTDEEIRDYAYHLYEQSGCIPGRDEENWYEARECLRARVRPAPGAPRVIHHEEKLVQHV